MAYKLFNYNPSLPAAIAFAVVFSLLTLIQSFLVFHVGVRQNFTINYGRKKRLCCIMIPFIVGLLMESVGYVARAFATQDKDSIIVYCMQSTFILIAPVLMAATLYMVFGELVKTTNTEQHTCIRMKYFTKILVAADVVSLLVQAAGGGLIAMDSARKWGKIIVIVGLFIQIIFFGGFFILSIVYTIQVHKHARTLVSKYSHWTLSFVVLFITSLLILVRSVFRVVEFFGGYDGAIASNEKLIYGLDAVPILVGSIIFVFFNYSRILCKYQTLNDSNDFLLVNKVVPSEEGSQKESYY
ncbi:BA75_04991T0 [Komagataella pastoris]|uniref:BA75_04991T0 n=1 Tax=Komagataella pastoris TaxID=4922 RepID=A0A1B2JJ29_PICPA|nr:BA75_04991T0 [Komagataella pastoris]